MIKSFQMKLLLHEILSKKTLNELTTKLQKITQI